MAGNAELIARAPWVKVVRDVWGAVPAVDLLAPESTFWTQLKLAPLSPEEAIALGLVGRLLKYGQSLAIALPLHGGDSATRLMIYLHRLRFDALEGGLRTPWLNPANMEDRPDVVFICRPKSRFQEFYRVPDIHGRILRKGETKSIRKSKGSLTLLVDGSMDVMDLADLIAKETLPMALVIDATVGGFRGSEQLDSALMECFPTVPRLILLTLGDDEAIQRFRTVKSQSHLWLMRVGDSQLLAASTSPNLLLDVGSIMDATANSALQNLCSRLFDLRRELERARDPVLKEKLSILGKVFRAMNEAIVPLPYLESRLEGSTRSGMFPVRTLQRWLAVAAQSSCEYGETQAKADVFCRELVALHTLLKESITGKAVWTIDCVRAAQDEQRAIMILCGSQYEAAALESWLQDMLDPGWAEFIHIVPMDGVKSARRVIGKMSEVVVTGMLWPSRQHWLSTPCQRMTVLAYPYEAERIKRLLQVWGQKYAVASRLDGDKYRLWALDWGSDRCLDSEVVAGALEIETRPYAVTPTYPTRRVTAAVPLPMDHDDWLEELLAEPEELPTTLQESDVQNRDFVWIQVEEYDAALAWAKSRRVQVLQDNGIEPTLPEFLETGDRIILFRNSEERVATQERLFELVAEESEGMHQYIKAAERWQALVSTVSKTHKSAQLNSLLKREGISLTDAAVANWYRHRVYGPSDPKAVLVLARLAAVRSPESSARVISKAIQKVRTMHQQIGRQINQALKEVNKGATEVTIGLLRLDAATFQEMFEIATVREVRHPAPALGDDLAAETLERIIDDVMQTYPDRLLFTNAALKSVNDSNYRDLDKFRACLTRMATDLYDSYKSKTTRMQPILDAFQSDLITFAQGMSDVTMGKYGPNLKYKNRAADLNRHFRLGTARDKTRTMRIHFEWDADDNRLVIHHAGEHLPTSQN